MPSPDAATDLARARVSSAPSARVAREPSTTSEAETARSFGFGWRTAPITPAWALPPLVYLAAIGLADAQVDPTEVAEGRFIGLLAAGVVAAIVALESQSTRRSVTASTWTGIGAIMTLWLLHHGAHRGSVATWILIGGLGWALAGALRARGATPSVTIAAAIGLQIVMRPDLLLPPLLDARTVVSVVGLPIAVGLAIAGLAATFGTRRAILAAAIAAVLAPGWNVHVTTTLLAVAAGLPLLGLHRPERRRMLVALGVVATVAGAWITGDLQGATAGAMALALAIPTGGALGAVVARAAAGLVVVVAGLAGYPWCRTDPLVNLARSTGEAWLGIVAATVVGLVALWVVDRQSNPTHQRWAATTASAALLIAAGLALPLPVEVTFAGPPPLTIDRVAMDVALDPATRRVTLDSDLVHAAHLAESTAVARAFWLAADGTLKGRWAMRAGLHTADWAAGRADLESLPAPEPWMHRLTPAGEFFAQRYRMTIDFDADIEVAAGDRLVLRRVPRLDPAVQLRIHRVEQHP